MRFAQQLFGVSLSGLLERRSAATGDQTRAETYREDADKAVHLTRLYARDAAVVTRGFKVADARMGQRALT